MQKASKKGVLGRPSCLEKSSIRKKMLDAFQRRELRDQPPFGNEASVTPQVVRNLSQAVKKGSCLGESVETDCIELGGQARSMAWKMAC